MAPMAALRTNASANLGPNDWIELTWDVQEGDPEFVDFEVVILKGPTNGKKRSSLQEVILEVIYTKPVPLMGKVAGKFVAHVADFFNILKHLSNLKAYYFSLRVGARAIKSGLFFVVGLESESMCDIFLALDEESTNLNWIRNLPECPLTQTNVAPPGWSVDCTCNRNRAFIDCPIAKMMNWYVNEFE